MTTPPPISELTHTASEGRRLVNALAVVVGVGLIVAAVVIVLAALRPPPPPMNPIDGEAATAEIQTFGSDHAAAIAQYSSSIASAPDDPHAVYMLGRAHFIAGDYASALPALRKAQRLSPNDAEILYYVTRTRYRLGDQRDIKADLERVLQLDPSHAEAAHFLAGQYLLDEHLATALRYAEQAVRQAPNNDKVYHNRGIVYYRTGEYRRAIADLSRALRTNDQVPGALYWRGAAYRAIGDYQAAIDDLERSVQGEPSNLVAQLELAYAYSNVRDLPRAERALSAILERNPGFSEALFERTMVRYELADYRGAITDVDALLQLDERWERDLRPWATRGVARYQLGDVDGALEDYSRSIAILPSPQMLTNRGQIYTQRAQYAEARADFDAAISVDASYADAYRYRATVFEQLGDRPAAVADLRRAEELYLRAGNEPKLREVHGMLRAYQSTP